MVIDLAGQMENAFDDLSISEEQRRSIQTFLGPLELKDQASWEHSVRVGLKNVEVARFTHLYDPVAFFYVGLLHDVGKTLTDPRSLKKKEGFGAKDKRELDRHVLDGYKMLRGAHDFTARAMLWHHYFSAGYPAKTSIPKGDIDFSEATELMAMNIGRYTGLNDFQDAITTRKNDKFSLDGKPCLPSREQARDLTLKCNPDQTYLINALYDEGIFR